MNLFGVVGGYDGVKLPCYLKWKDTTIGVMDRTTRRVKFREAALEPVVEWFLKKGKSSWSEAEFTEFLLDRFPSAYRRDIDTVLLRNGLDGYDPFKLAASTRAISARDYFWLAFSENEKMEDRLHRLFGVSGLEALHTPDGVNVKEYSVCDGKYGILKSRLFCKSSDAESEVAVYELGKLLGVDVCPAKMVGDKVFSEFKYDLENEYLIHMRQMLEARDISGDLYSVLVRDFPQFSKDIKRMIVLDFVTRQTDRHMSNLALKVSGRRVRMYPLYDNGRSLFFEDSVETMGRAIGAVKLFSTEFGGIGTYYDIIEEMKETDKIGKLVRLDVSREEVEKAYSVLPKGRRYYAVEWTMRSLEVLKN